MWHVGFARACCMRLLEPSPFSLTPHSLPSRLDRSPVHSLTPKPFRISHVGSIYAAASLHQRPSYLLLSAAESCDSDSYTWLLVLRPALTMKRSISSLAQPIEPFSQSAAQTQPIWSTSRTSTM
eukprot:7781981-Pyramimonas_sp.AAC.1